MFFYDTNAVLSLGENLGKFGKFGISSVTILELENIKTSRNKDDEVKYKARVAANWLWNHESEYHVYVFTRDDAVELQGMHLEDNNDNKICYSAKYIVCQLDVDDSDITFVTDDTLCRLIASAVFGLKVAKTPELDNKLYYGYKEISIGDDEIANLYQNMSDNTFGLKTNEYLVVKDLTGKVIDTLKWTGEFYKKVVDMTIRTKMFGVLRPLDEIQSCAIDTIANNQITVLYGKAGSGKTTLPLNYMMQQLEKGKIRKIYIVYSYDPLRNARELGYEAGDHITKLLQYGSIGNVLSTKFGGIEQVESLIESGQIDIIPTANIRGVEFSEDSCVLVTEALNLDVYTLKTIIQRCKTGCKQVYEGDIIEQKDTAIGMSGVQRVIEVFSGNDWFGCIKLKNNYRNKIGEFADLL